MEPRTAAPPGATGRIGVNSPGTGDLPGRPRVGITSVSRRWRGGPRAWLTGRAVPDLLKGSGPFSCQENGATTGVRLARAVRRSRGGGQGAPEMRTAPPTAASVPAVFADAASAESRAGSGLSLQSSRTSVMRRERSLQSSGLGYWFRWRLGDAPPHCLSQFNILWTCP